MYRYRMKCRRDTIRQVADYSNLCIYLGQPIIYNVGNHTYCKGLKKTFYKRVSSKEHDETTKNINKT